MPPIRFADCENRVGIRMRENATHVEIYQSSCDGVEGDALKSITLPRGNDYTTFVLDHHDDLFEVNAGGVKGLSPKKHEYCEDETFSATVPDIFHAFPSDIMECDDYDPNMDPKLRDLVRVLVTIKFDTVAESPFLD